MSECSFRWAGDGYKEALPVVTLWGRRWTRPALLARLAGYGTAWDGDDCVLWAEGEVLQAAVFGEQLLLRACEVRGLAEAPA